jgi:EmrB/QacA subfamily drug resistance transporter
MDQSPDGNEMICNQISTKDQNQRSSLVVVKRKWIGIAAMISQFSRSTAVACLVAAAFFMENLDGTVIVTAMPNMAISFGVHPVDLNIAISAYLLTLAVLIPASGWMADRFGTRRVFTCAIALFTFASLLCGFAHNLQMFIGFRILQGCGGAMMVPVGRLTVLRTTEKEKLMNAIATLTWPGLVAPILGPPIGGFITTYASWQWIFLLNIPLGILGVVMSVMLLPSLAGTKKRPFDFIGFMLTGLACFCLMFGLDAISQNASSIALGYGSLIGSLVIGFAAVRHARRKTDPLVDLWAFGLPSFSVAIHSAALARLAIGALPFMLPLLLQIGFGLDAFSAGLLLLFVFAGNLAMKPLTSPVLRLLGFRGALLWSGSLNAVAIFGCAFLTPAMPLPMTAALFFFNGLTRSMLFTAYNTLAFVDIPQLRMSGANTVFNVMQQLTMGIGVTCGALALQIAAFFHATPTNTISLLNFRVAFMLIALLSLISVIDALQLDVHAGEDVTGRIRK